jgi:uncharacterized membrane protein YdfJ with MMPL/SSD domain
MVATGFLGMNIFSQADLGVAAKIGVFLAVFVPTILLTVYTVLISRRLATFMEALASERMTWSEKKEAFRQIWTSPKRAREKRVAGDESSRSATRPIGDAVHSSD